MESIVNSRFAVLALCITVDEIIINYKLSDATVNDKGQYLLK